MASLLSGEKSVAPWIEQAITRAAQGQPPTTTSNDTAKLAQIIQIIGPSQSPYMRVSDGRTSVFLFLSKEAADATFEESSSRPRIGCIAKISRWHVTTVELLRQDLRVDVATSVFGEHGNEWKDKLLLCTSARVVMLGGSGMGIIGCADDVHIRIGLQRVLRSVPDEGTLYALVRQSQRQTSSPKQNGLQQEASATDQQKHQKQLPVTLGNPRRLFGEDRLAGICAQFGHLSTSDAAHLSSHTFQTSNIAASAIAREANVVQHDAENNVAEVESEVESEGAFIVAIDNESEIETTSNDNDGDIDDQQVPKTTTKTIAVFSTAIRGSGESRDGSNHIGTPAGDSSDALIAITGTGRNNTAKLPQIVPAISQPLGSSSASCNLESNRESKNVHPECTSLANKTSPVSPIGSNIHPPPIIAPAKIRNGKKRKRLGGDALRALYSTPATSR